MPITGGEVQTLAEYVVGLAISPDYRNDGTVVATTYLKGAYLSSDRGMTWEGRHVGLGTSEGSNSFAPIHRLTNVHFSPNYVNDGTIFTAGHTSLLKSTDRGASWKGDCEVLPPEATQQLFAIAVSPSYATDRTVFVGSTFGTVFRSASGGAAGTWTRLGSVGGKVQSLLLSPRFPADPVLYAGTSTGIFKSVDAGLHWARTGPAGPSMLAISPNYGLDGTVFAGTEQRAVRDPQSRIRLDRALRLSLVDLEPDRDSRALTELRDRPDGSRQRGGEGLVPVGQPWDIVH